MLIKNSLQKIKMMGLEKKNKVREIKICSETIIITAALPPPNSCRRNTEEAESESGRSWQEGDAVDSLRIMKITQGLHP